MSAVERAWPSEAVAPKLSTFKCYSCSLSLSLSLSLCVSPIIAYRARPLMAEHEVSAAWSSRVRAYLPVAHPCVAKYPAVLAVAVDDALLVLPAVA